MACVVWGSASQSVIPPEGIQRHHQRALVAGRAKPSVDLVTEALGRSRLDCGQESLGELDGVLLGLQPRTGTAIRRVEEEEEVEDDEEDVGEDDDLESEDSE